MCLTRCHYVPHWSAHSLTIRWHRNRSSFCELLNSYSTKTYPAMHMHCRATVSPPFFTPTQAKWAALWTLLTHHYTGVEWPDFHFSDIQLLTDLQTPPVQTAASLCRPQALSVVADSVAILHHSLSVYRLPWVLGLPLHIQTKQQLPGLVPGWSKGT